MSLLPKSAAGCILTPTNITLSSANGSPITVFGETRLQLAFPALRRVYNWSFVVANVLDPIIGKDFLCHYKLVVDCGSRCLRDTETSRSYPAAPAAATIPCLIVNDTSTVAPPARQLLSDFNCLISPRHSDEPSAQSSQVVHTIDTGSAAPVCAGRRRFSPEKQAAISNEIGTLLREGIVRPSHSCWSALVHLVAKPDGGFRLTGDYRLLNAATKRDCYPIPHIHDCSIRLRGAKLFSKLDLSRAYHQVPVAEQDIAKTAVTTPDGLFEYMYMPYGLRNAPATFQRYMDSIFRGLEFVFIYIDDILVFSEDSLQHQQHLRTVF